MSADAAPRPRERRRRWLRWLLAAGAVLLLVPALALWLLFPWGSIDGLRVEQARIVGGEDGRRADMNGNGEALEVTFSVPADLETLRARKDAGFINALVSSCSGKDFRVRENIVQRAEYFRPGRVSRLTAAGTGPARYRVTIDSVLAARRGAGHAIVSLRKLPPGDLCFSLEGGSMWAGKLWSDRVRLRVPGPAAD